MHVLDHFQVSLNKQRVKIVGEASVEGHLLLVACFVPQLRVFDSANDSWQLSIECSRFPYIVLLTLSPESLAPCTGHRVTTSL